MNVYKYRAVDVRITKSTDWKERLKYIWGADIFINDIPIIKTMLLTNALVWMILIFNS
jgi:hypothetical protein